MQLKKTHVKNIDNKINSNILIAKYVSFMNLILMNKYRYIIVTHFIINAITNFDNNMSSRNAKSSHFICYS